MNVDLGLLVQNFVQSDNKTKSRMGLDRIRYFGLTRS